VGVFLFQGNIRAFLNGSAHKYQQLSDRKLKAIEELGTRNWRVIFLGGVSIPPISPLFTSWLMFNI
jgi:hypothetical protein